MWHCLWLVWSKQSRTFGSGSVKVLHAPAWKLKFISTWCSNLQPLILLALSRIKIDSILCNFTLRLFRPLPPKYQKILRKVAPHPPVAPILRSNFKSLFMFPKRNHFLRKQIKKYSPLMSTINGLLYARLVFRTSIAFLFELVFVVVTSKDLVDLVVVGIAAVAVLLVV